MTAPEGSTEGSTAFSEDTAVSERAKIRRSEEGSAARSEVAWSERYISFKKNTRI